MRPAPASMAPVNDAAPSPSSTWVPLRHPPFRGLWAGGLYFIGNAMQTWRRRG